MQRSHTFDPPTVRGRPLGRSGIVVGDSRPDWSVCVKERNVRWRVHCTLVSSTVRVCRGVGHEVAGFDAEDVAEGNENTERDSDRVIPLSRNGSTRSRLFFIPTRAMCSRTRQRYCISRFIVCLSSRTISFTDAATQRVRQHLFQMACPVVGGGDRIDGGRCCVFVAELHLHEAQVVSVLGL